MINGVTMGINMDPYLLSALREDITSEDVSTNAVMHEKKMGTADLICKQDGVLCGLPVFERVFHLLDREVMVNANVPEGQEIKKGDLVATVTGDMRAILSGERVALNYLQRMSGIAALTKKAVAALAGSKTKLLDTRKTTPNMRLFEKYAVKIGGGCNHRYNLSDGLMLKDNHIGAAGGVAKAVAMARAYAPFVRKIEVEVEDLDMLREAVEAGADIIMLDNMDLAAMAEAVKIVDGRAETECSGNVTVERLREIGQIGVDYVSMGALTYGATPLDLSLKNLRPIETA